MHKFAKKCELPEGSAFWSFMNFFFCQFMILYGSRVYKRIKKEFPDKQLIFIASKDAGDVVFYSYFKDYMFQLLKKNESDTILVCTNSNVNSYKALNISNIYPIPMPEVAALSMAYHYYGSEKMDLVNAYSWCLFDYGNIQNKDIKPQHPKFSVNKENLLSALSDIGCIPGKTVILAPYEQQITVEHELVPVWQFWSELAEALKNEGFNVCTNCRGDQSEPPIDGTKHIFPRFGDCEELISLAGYSIILRSGFADFTAMTDGTVIVLYPSARFWNKYRIWNSCDISNHHEIIYQGSIEDEAYRKKLIDEIVRKVQYEKIN